MAFSDAEIDALLSAKGVGPPVIKRFEEIGINSFNELADRQVDEIADLVVFPELSLTGYELELLEQLAMPKDSAVFSTLSDAAAANNIVVIAGCPLVSEGRKPQIGAVICFPNGERAFYAKQYLHEGEEVYCSSGNASYLFTLNGTRITLAICADFTNPAHSETAGKPAAKAAPGMQLVS